MINVKNHNFLPMVLVILDGWGLAPKSKSNPIGLAKTPTMDLLVKKYPASRLVAYGQMVGLPTGQDGNSEAGHMNLGAGRIVVQDAVHITQAIKSGQFFSNTALLAAVDHARQYNSNLHLMGLLSNGQSAHSQPEHLYALLEFLKQQKFSRVYLHLFTDGRDSSPHAASRLISKLINNFQNGEIISTIMGRFYGMDRIKAWSRTKMAYNAMVLGQGIGSDNPYKAITEAYNRGETDEFIIPTVILNPVKKAKFINDNDSIIFFNLRSDRARQMSKPFVQHDFEQKNPGAFKRGKILQNLKFVALTDFGPDLDSINTAFPSNFIHNSLPLVLQDFKQLYLSEREKYAHVTYFFNGGHSRPVNGEKWEVIPSVGKGNYTQHPQMSSHKLTDIVIRNLRAHNFDFITINYPNPDMLGHTGDIKAAIKAISIVDKCLGRLYKVLNQLNGTLIVTADHGNVEEMLNLKTGEMDTEHSTNPVPFILVNKKLAKAKLKPTGILADVAPTILDILDLKQPKEMTGKSLLKK